MVGSSISSEIPIESLRFNKTFKANTFESYEKTPLRPFTRKAIRKTLKNPNVNRKISHGQKFARKLLKLNGCLTKGTCFVAGQSNENISHNLIIGNEKKSNCDNGLAPIQPQ